MAWSGWPSGVLEIMSASRSPWLVGRGKRMLCFPLRLQRLTNVEEKGVLCACVRRVEEKNPVSLFLPWLSAEGASRRMLAPPRVLWVR